MEFTHVSPYDLQTNRLLRKVTLVDVRDPDEYQTAHIPGAVSIPKNALSPATLMAATGNPRLGREETLYLTCLSGIRSQQAASALAEAGLHNVALLEGGMDHWRKAKLPIRRCAAALSLERQVQLAVGLLVLTMTALGYLLNPLFFAFAAVIGLGLVSASLTNWCGLGRLLALMPWNQQRGCTQGI
ncbi:MAG: rhodanese-like domain-containing protein [Gammaproteobacteria bacterium]